MTTFNYRFQKVLDVKIREKEVAQSNMATAMEQQRVAEEKVQFIEDKIQELQSRMQKQQTDGVSINELIANQNYLAKLHTELMFEQRQLNSAKLQVTQKQYALHNKLKEEKTWETLKENEKETHIKETNRIENLQLEEIAIQKYYRQKVAHHL